MPASRIFSREIFSFFVSLRLNAFEVRPQCLWATGSSVWGYRFVLRAPFHPIEPHECPVHANQGGDEEQELSDEDEHRFVDDALWRHPERRDADAGRDDGEPDGDDFFGVECLHGW